VSDDGVIDPDAFPETEDGRVWTPERNAEAWRSAFAVLRGARRRLGPAGGRRQRPAGSGDIDLDRAAEAGSRDGLVRRRLAGGAAPHIDSRHARAFVVPAEAVWIRTPLPVALEQNRRRAADRVVPEETIRSVARLFEPPTCAEGFAAVRVIEPGSGLGATASAGPPRAPGRTSR
jgi:hypothetical protein